MVRDTRTSAVQSAPSFDGGINKTSIDCIIVYPLYLFYSKRATRRKLLLLLRTTTCLKIQALVAVYMVLTVTVASGLFFSLWHLAQFRRLPATARSARRTVTRLRLVIAARYGPVHGSSTSSFMISHSSYTGHAYCGGTVFAPQSIPSLYLTLVCVSLDHLLEELASAPQRARHRPGLTARGYDG